MENDEVVIESAINKLIEFFIKTNIKIIVI